MTRLVASRAFIRISSSSMRMVKMADGTDKPTPERGHEAPKRRVQRRPREQTGRSKAWTHREFGGKTVWDWMQLLIVPIMLSLITVAFTWQQNARQQHTEDQRTQQAQEIEDRRARAERDLQEQRAQQATLQARPRTTPSISRRPLGPLARTSGTRSVLAPSSEAIRLGQSPGTATPRPLTSCQPLRPTCTRPQSRL